MSTENSIGHRFKVRAAFVGMTQAEVAREGDIRPQVLSYQLTKADQPSVEVFRKVAGVLQVPMGYFLDDACECCGMTWQTQAAALPFKTEEEAEPEAA